MLKFKVEENHLWNLSARSNAPAREIAVCARTLSSWKAYIISIRIWSRDLEQHMLAKQHQVESDVNLTFRGDLTMAVATRFSAVTVCSFAFGSCSQQSSSLLYHSATFLLRKQTSPMHPCSLTISATGKTHGGAVASPQQLQREIFTYHMSSYLIWR
jgi:hypothetical protein